MLHGVDAARWAARPGRDHLGPPDRQPGFKDPKIVDLNEATALAKWRSTERDLEAGLDPELRKRLDALRLEDANLLRRHPVRQVDLAPVDRDYTLRRTG